MPLLESFALCESTSIDQRTQRLSMFNIIEGIRATPVQQSDDGGPSVRQIVAATLVMRWLFDPDESRDGIRFRLVALAPDGKQRFWVHDDDFPQLPQELIRTVIELDGVPVSGQPGRHAIELSLVSKGRAKRVGRITYAVHMPPPTSTH